MSYIELSEKCSRPFCFSKIIILIFKINYKFIFKINYELHQFLFQKQKGYHHNNGYEILQFIPIFNVRDPVKICFSYFTGTIFDSLSIKYKKIETFNQKIYFRNSFICICKIKGYYCLSLYKLSLHFFLV